MIGVHARATVIVLLRSLLLSFLCCGLFAAPALAHCGCAHDLVSFSASAGFTASALPSGISRSQVEDRTYLSYTTEVLDNLLTYGTDTY